MAGPSGTTARLALPYPIGGDTVDVPRDVLALATKLDPTTMSWAQGVVGSRPAAGFAGRFYHATDVSAGGTLFYDNGSSWIIVAPESVGGAVNVNMDTWHLVGAAGEPGFTSSWKNLDNNAAVPGTAAQRNAGFRKFPDGKVKLMGTITAGASGTTAFSLPVGYRPLVQEAFSVIAASSGGNTPTTVNITSAGAVSPTNTGTGSAVTTWCYLDGIEFDTQSVATFPSGWLGAPVVSALPASPADGQECYYLADAVNGVLWYLRYRVASASAYKWEFLGGPPLAADIATVESTSSTTYVDLATPGPSLTLALAGDYDIQVAAGYNRNANATTTNWMSFAVGATAASDTDGPQYDSLVAGQGGPSWRMVRKTAMSAGSAVVMKYRSAGPSAALFAKRSLRITPVRVG